MIPDTISSRARKLVEVEAEAYRSGEFLDYNRGAAIEAPDIARAYLSAVQVLLTIAGKQQPIDNLMGNDDLARAWLKEHEEG